MIKKLFFILLLLQSILSNAQEPILNKRFIEVTGTSEIEITPDELFVTITLLERVEGKDKLTIDKQEAELRNSIKELGIDLSQLTLSTANADYRKIKAFKKDVMVSKSYILKISGVEMLSKLYDRLDKMNAFDAYISRYTHSKILDIQKENRIKAIKAAKEKAEYLLSAVGQQAGQPIQILESDNFVQDQPGYPGRIAYKSANVMMDRNEESSDDISFKKIKVRNSYIVKYEILPK